MTILKIAWKNVWRNKLRSFVVVLAVSSGLLGGVFAVALMNGATSQKTKSAIDNEISHIQIHHNKFSENNDSKYIIDNYKEIITDINSFEEVKSTSSRLRITGMISNSRGSTETTVYGITPENEEKVTGIYKTLQDTTMSYFKGKSKKQILISVQLADMLRVTQFKVTAESLKQLQSASFPEDKVQQISTLKDITFKSKKKFIDTLKTIVGTNFVLDNEYAIKKSTSIFKQKAKLNLKFQNPIDSAGNLTQALFKTCGVFKTGNGMFDSQTVFVKDNYLRKLSGFSENQTHEIAILLNDIEQSNLIAEKLKVKYPNLEIQTWKEIQPELAMMASMMQYYNYIFIGIILFALAFGIINTMLMAILERTKELGMLAAVGMNKVKIFKMILLETVFLTITGAIGGIFANIFLISYFGEKGVDFSKSVAEGFEAVGYSPIIYPEVSASLYVGITALVIATAILSAIYPAIKAIKLRPAEAVR